MARMTRTTYSLFHSILFSFFNFQFKSFKFFSLWVTIVPQSWLTKPVFDIIQRDNIPPGSSLRSSVAWPIANIPKKSEVFNNQKNEETTRSYEILSISGLVSIVDCNA